MPEVSVVMSVYNGQKDLPTTLASILSQHDCDFEFIVVNDGSADRSGQILDEFQSCEPRLRVLHQSNAGLTRALRRGCEAATGEFIARQDVGDVSLSGRLRDEVALLRTRPDVALVSCATRFVAPRGEDLYDLRFTGSELDDGLRRLDVNTIRGPSHHGSTMFRRDAYLRVGGYRPEFVVAQDMDLWLRLAEVGPCWGLPTIGYEAKVEANGISGRRRDEQLVLGALAIACALQRRAGKTDTSLLTDFVPPPRQPRGPMSRREHAKFLYFVGSCLRGRDALGARAYFAEALRTDPTFLKALLRMLFG